MRVFVLLMQFNVFIIRRDFIYRRVRELLNILRDFYVELTSDLIHFSRVIVFKI